METWKQKNGCINRNIEVKKQTGLKKSKNEYSNVEDK